MIITFTTTIEAPRDDAENSYAIIQDLLNNATMDGSLDDEVLLQTQRETDLLGPEDEDDDE